MVTASTGKRGSVPHSNLTNKKRLMRPGFNCNALRARMVSKKYLTQKLFTAKNQNREKESFN